MHVQGSHGWLGGQHHMEPKRSSAADSNEGKVDSGWGHAWSMSSTLTTQTARCTTWCDLMNTQGPGPIPNSRYPAAPEKIGWMQCRRGRRCACDGRPRRWQAMLLARHTRAHAQRKHMLSSLSLSLSRAHTHAPSHAQMHTHTQIHMYTHGLCQAQSSDHEQRFMMEQLHPASGHPYGDCPTSFTSSHPTQIPSPKFKASCINPKSQTPPPRLTD
jgi:hypothetical protein